MPKRAAGLTAAGVKAAKPGIHVDGHGLMLVVKPAGSATWVLRFQIAGKRRDMGLGPARAAGAVTLADARLKAAEARKLIAEGIDPLAQRQAEEAASEAARRTAEAASAAEAMTFRTVADQYLSAHEAGWRSTKHRAQWEQSLRDYAGPHLDALPVSDVETRHIQAALQAIWTKYPETASRLRGRIEAVLDYATVQGWRDGANPARWRGHLDKLFPRRAKIKEVEHFAALPWQEIGAFMAQLRQRDATAARALEFAILTGARSGETLGMRWSEIDLAGAVWTVPKSRMKAGREHRVPLSPCAIKVLRSLTPLRDASEIPDPFVFPGQDMKRCLSNMAMAMVLRRMKRGDLTVHGFRSCFRDWAGETTAHAREVVEQAMAHRIGDKAEQAYARGDLFTKRRRLMEDWAEFCSRAPAAVVQIGEARAPAAAVGG